MRPSTWQLPPCPRQNEPLTIEQLRAELEQVKRERDAAIEAANGLDKMIGRAWGRLTWNG